jgi:hypothetical protein
MFSLVAYFLDLEFNRRGRRDPISVGEVARALRSAFREAGEREPGTPEILLAVRRLILAQVVSIGPPRDGDTLIIVLDRARLRVIADAYTEEVGKSGDLRALRVVASLTDGLGVKKEG